MDIIDRAQRQETHARQAAIALICEALHAPAARPKAADGHIHCHHCDAIISAARLKVLPQARHCVACQTALERHSQTHRRR